MPSDANENFKFVRASDFKNLYCNFMSAAFTFFDVAITMGEFNGEIVEERARVSMSPAEAKILINILKNTIKNYESKFGEIKVPEGIMVPLNED